jgi:hypothetical protein
LINISCSNTTEESPILLILRNNIDELVKARKQLKVDREEFEKERGGMQRSIEKTDVIRLNVGGEPMMTTRATLTRVSKSVLATMFNGRWEHKLGNDKDGNIFLDFNPMLFRHLLDQLRVLKDDDSIMFHSPSSSSLVVPFEKMLRKLGLNSSSSKSSEAVITLDVGGEIVTTRPKTLSSIPNFKLVPAVSSSNKTSTDANGHLFLDYAPKLFRHLLGQLREGKTNTSGFNAPSNEEKDAFNVMLSDLNLSGT